MSIKTLSNKKKKYFKLKFSTFHNPTKNMLFVFDQSKDDKAFILQISETMENALLRLKPRGQK